MNDAQRAIAVIESCLRVRLSSALRAWWASNPTGVSVRRPVMLIDCPTTGDDFLDEVWGVLPENKVLAAIQDHPWTVVQHVLPIGTFASASLLVCRFDDELSRLYAIDIAEQCGPYGPKTLYEVAGMSLGDLSRC